MFLTIPNITRIAQTQYAIIFSAFVRRTLPVRTYLTDKITAIAMPSGSRHKTTGFALNAPAKSSLSRHKHIVVTPQPGHFNPVMSLKMQGILIWKQVIISA